MSDEFVQSPVIPEEPSEQPEIPDVADQPPLFVEDSKGKLSIDWQGSDPSVTRITPEALQMLVDRANNGRPSL